MMRHYDILSSLFHKPVSSCKEVVPTYIVKPIKQPGDDIPKIEMGDGTKCFIKLIIIN